MRSKWLNQVVMLEQAGFQMICRIFPLARVIHRLVAGETETFNDESLLDHIIYELLVNIDGDMV